MELHCSKSIQHFERSLLFYKFFFSSVSTTNYTLCFYILCLIHLFIIHTTFNAPQCCPDITGAKNARYLKTQRSPLNLMNGFDHLHSTQSRYFVFLTTVHCGFHLWKQTSTCSQLFLEFIHV